MLVIRVISDEQVQQEVVAKVVEIYSEAFSGPPWNEDWSLERSREALLGTLSSGSFDLAISMQDGEITGFGIGIPLCQAFDLEWFLALGFEPHGTYYIADLATSGKHRKIGSCLAYTAALVDAAERRNFKRIAVRTLRNNEPVIRTVKRLGFHLAAEGVVDFDGITTERTVFARAFQTDSDSNGGAEDG